MFDKVQYFIMQRWPCDTHGGSACPNILEWLSKIRWGGILRTENHFTYTHGTAETEKNTTFVEIRGCGPNFEGHTNDVWKECFMGSICSQRMPIFNHWFSFYVAPFIHLNLTQTEYFVSFFFHLSANIAAISCSDESLNPARARSPYTSVSTRRLAHIRQLYYHLCMQKETISYLFSTFVKLVNAAIFLRWSPRQITLYICCTNVGTHPTKVV